MAYQTPNTLKYTKEHEWAKLEGDVLTVGITDFAQSALGDIVFVELPEVGRELSEGQTFGVVESIKSVSDLFSPLEGVVVESNKDLEGAPEQLNGAPYDSWMIKIKLNDPSKFNALLDVNGYTDYCSSL
jgi:glycine cleavage system H protein